MTRLAALAHGFIHAFPLASTLGVTASLTALAVVVVVMSFVTLAAFDVHILVARRRYTLLFAQ